MRKKIIDSFFNYLSNSNIEYAILHHIDKLYNLEDDIDFVVNCNKTSFFRILKEFAIQKKYYVGSNFTIDKNIHRFDLFFFNNKQLEKIELDCACNSTGKDLLQINAADLLKNRIKIEINGVVFFKVENKDEIDYYIKKKAYKGVSINQYHNYFKNLNKDISIQKIEKDYSFWKNYYSSCQFKMKFFLNKISLFFARLGDKPSLSICFLGPDGSGKSTIINEIIRCNIFINNNYFHLKPIPQNEHTVRQVVTDPHQYKPYSFLKSYIKLLFFVYQYNMGWLKNITRLKIKSSLIIFDRYYDDLLADNKRYRYGGSKSIAKFIRYFIPKPDLYFILTADADIIHKRKQEVPLHELQRQIKAYRSLADNKRYINIDVSKKPKEIVLEITKIIMQKMNERY